VVSFAPPPRPLAPAAFRQLAGVRGLRLDSRTRLLYAGSRIGINGATVAVAAAERAAIAQLADRRRLPAAACRRLSAVAVARLHDWYVCGWLHPG
jgi:50S ribosomal protein L16 3-hydroxylase